MNAIWTGVTISIIAPLTVFIIQYYWKRNRKAREDFDMLMFKKKIKDEHQIECPAYRDYDNISESLDLIITEVKEITKAQKQQAENDYKHKKELNRKLDIMHIGQQAVHSSIANYNGLGKEYKKNLAQLQDGYNLMLPKDEQIDFGKSLLD